MASFLTLRGSGLPYAGCLTDPGRPQPESQIVSKRDYYEVLGVERTADTAQIKKAYKKLALELHPDRNPDDAEAEARFKEASEAYQVLSDGQKRQSYDRFGHTGLRGQGFGDIQDIFSNFQDVFGDLFGFAGMGGRPGGPSRGADLRAMLELTLEEAAFGAKKELSLKHPSPCEACQGTGADGGELQACVACGGAGQVAMARGIFTMSTTCSRCGGRGAIPKRACERCDGSGETALERTVQVQVPAGVDNGQTLRLSGQGQEGTQGGPPGHLYVTVQVRDDPRFQRDGADLIHELKITFPQAALGAEVDVPTLKDPHTLRVPAGVQPGDTLLVRGKGVPRLDGRGQGDLVVLFQVTVPTKLSKRATELLEELATTFED